MEFETWFGKIELEASSENSVPNESALPKPNLRAQAILCGVAYGDRDYNIRLRSYAIDRVKRQLKESASDEANLLQAVQALDDIYASINLLDERLYEWSRLHSQEIIHGKDLARSLCSDETVGILARSNLCLRKAADEMETDLSERAQSLAPNLSALAGPVLAARLISRAGSLNALARMPSSRVQVMGAEKSLFKHLEGHASSPKHGLIFRHPLVSGSPRRLRGKVARMLAGRLALAARLDFFGGDVMHDIKSDIEKRMRIIKSKGKISSRKKG